MCTETQQGASYCIIELMTFGSNPVLQLYQGEEGNMAFLVGGSPRRGSDFSKLASNASDAGHNDLPPTRDTRYRHRPSARRTNCAESVLPRLQIMGSALPNAPLWPRHVYIHIHRRVDEGLSRSVQLSHSLHSDPHTSRPPARRRYRPSPSDPHFPLPQPRELEHTFRVQWFGR